LLRNHLLVKDNKTSYILNDGRCNENIDSIVNTNKNENSSCDNGDYGYIIYDKEGKILDSKPINRSRSFRWPLRNKN